MIGNSHCKNQSIWMDGVSVSLVFCVMDEDHILYLHILQSSKSQDAVEILGLSLKCPWLEMIGVNCLFFLFFLHLFLILS